MREGAAINTIRRLSVEGTGAALPATALTSVGVLLITGCVRAPVTASRAGADPLLPTRPRRSKRRLRRNRGLTRREPPVRIELAHYNQQVAMNTISFS